MTQIPDLVRATRWRLYLQLTWGATVAHEFEGVFPEDALEAARAKGLALRRLIRAEFQMLDSSEWRELPKQYLQEAIVLVTRT